MNRNPVFNHDDWHTTAEGIWEARATPHELDGRPPFEATCHTNRTGDDRWHWSLYQPINDNADAALEPTADGHAFTLAEAQRYVDHIARMWRDRPTEMAIPARLANYSEHSLVTCDGCGAAHRLGELLTADGYCDAELADQTICSSTEFDGLNIDVLSEAAPCE